MTKWRKDYLARMEKAQAASQIFQPGTLPSKSPPENENSSSV
jgi:hypothetical protein